jgi:hypothetical protein
MHLKLFINIARLFRGPRNTSEGTKVPANTQLVICGLAGNSVEFLSEFL